MVGRLSGGSTVAGSAVAGSDEEEVGLGRGRGLRTAARRPLIGYARISTAEGAQVMDRQLDALHSAGCERVFEDRASGARAERPGLAACLDHLRRGDVLVVLDLDRLGRLAGELVALIDGLEKRGVGFRALNSPMDTITPAGRAFLQIQAAFAEMERGVIRQRVREGLAAARARGRRGGRPRAMTPDKLRYARHLFADRSPRSRPSSAACRPPRSTTTSTPTGGRSAQGASCWGRGWRRPPGPTRPLCPGTGATTDADDGAAGGHALVRPRAAASRPAPLLGGAARAPGLTSNPDPRPLRA